MSERLGFALVLLVAIASIAGMLFSTGTQSTGSVIYGSQMENIPTNECRDTSCPGHGVAQPLLNAKGMAVYKDGGKPVCICPYR